MQVAEPQPEQFADPQTGSVQHLHHGGVPQAARLSLPRRRQQRLDLGEREHLRQRSPDAG